MNQEIYTGILVVIAIASVVSPIITTFINNCYKVEIIKLKIESDNLKRSNDLIIRVYENFLKNAGAVITSSGLEGEQDYLKSYGLVMIHVPIDVFDDIQMFNEFVSDGFWELARDQFKVITSKLRGIVERLNK